MTDDTPAFMLDTEVFNALADGRKSLQDLPSGRLMVIGVQADELNATPNAQRRAALESMFQRVQPATEYAASFAFGIEGAGWGQACWNDGTGNVERMLARLQELDKGKGRKKAAENQLRDILIAETAIKNNATLITGDENLRAVIVEFGGRATA